MARNAFIRFKKGTYLKGESLQKGFLGDSGWFEIEDWDWEITADTSYLKGGGASVGKANPGEFNFSHSYDKSSKGMSLNIIQGTHFEEMELVMLKQTGKETPEAFFSLVGKNVFMTKVSTEGNGEGELSQKITAVFKEIEVKYKPQKNDGSLDSEDKWGWNISTMTVIK